MNKFQAPYPETKKSHLKIDVWNANLSLLRKPSRGELFVSGALDHGTEALQAHGKKAELQADGSRYIDRFFVWDEPIFSLGCFGGTWGEFIEMTYSTLQETNIFF